MDPILEEKFHSIKEELEKAEEMQRQIVNSYGVKVIEKVTVILFITGLIFISGAIGNHWLIKSVGMLMTGATALLAIYPYKASDWVIFQELAILFFNGRIEQDIDVVCHNTAHKLRQIDPLVLNAMENDADWKTTAQLARTLITLM